MPGFNREEVAALLVRCHRRCCICHRFCGTKIETDHIVPAADSQDHSIENAIPVCFDCHAEIHAYNPRHPRGRRFTADELRGHKDQWLSICETKPEIFIEANRNIDIGPLQGMLDEFDYNLAISTNLDYSKIGFTFREEQLTRVIREGVLSTVHEDLRQVISQAYGAVSKANESVKNYNSQSTQDHQLGRIATFTLEAIKQAIPLIQSARNQLLHFVQSEDTTT